jgi:hypothetical protein
MMSVNLF